MNREEKAATVEEIAAQIGDSAAIFAIDYRGISVPQAAELRSKLRDADASFRVVKNRLTKLAADQAGQEDLKALLDGPTALTFVRGDTATAAKAISTFNRQHGVLTYKGGFMDGITLDEEEFTSIALLPSRDLLNAQFAGVVASPLTGLVRGLNAMIAGLAIQLAQIAEQELVSGEAPAAEGATAGDEPAGESPADEAPADEEPADEAPAEESPAEEPPTESAPEAVAPGEEPSSQAEGDQGEDAAGEDDASSSDETSQEPENEEE